MIPVWLLDLKFLNESAAAIAETSNPPHCPKKWSKNVKIGLRIFANQFLTLCAVGANNEGKS
jgi:hypothetical protein